MLGSLQGLRQRRLWHHQPGGACQGAPVTSLSSSSKSIFSWIVFLLEGIRFLFLISLISLCLNYRSIETVSHPAGPL